MTIKNMFELIPDRYEYEGQQMDDYIHWMKTPDAHSPIHSESMLIAKFDERFFTQRSSEMEEECCRYIELRHQRYRTDREKLDTEQCPLSTQNLPPQQVQAQAERWYDQKLQKLQLDLEVDLKFINERHKIMQQQCNHRIEAAQREFQEAKEARNN
jgi:hypothetical protein